MTGAVIELSRRAVACKGWRWMPGMLSAYGRVVEINPYGLLIGYTTGIILKNGRPGYPLCWEASPSFRLPDLTDPATLGCLLALVREAWDQDDLAAVRFVGRWCVEHTPAEEPHRAWYGATEAEALVCALEAAP